MEHVVLFASENWPALHSKHSVAADVFENDPAEHDWHVSDEVMPVPVEYAPYGQATHCWYPLKYPALHWKKDEQLDLNDSPMKTLLGMAVRLHEHP